MRREASILHVDLDAMFAAVEQRDKPSLRGKPVIVGGVAGRGVVATASYEARAFGAHSAMPMAQARRRCPPNTAYLSPRFRAYQRTSAVVMELLAGVSPLVEQVSIDEAYVDLAPTGRDLSVTAVTDLALRLKAEIAVATGGVTGSIGAASSKLLAKIGSDLHKPDGLTVVPPGEELAVLHPLPVRRLGGVGPATEQRLHRSGIRTVGDLAAVDLDDLVDWFGTAHGHGLHRLARAEDNRPVVSDREAKSVSAEETFDVDVTDPVRLHRELDLLSARVARRLRDSGLTGRTVNIKVRHPDFTTVTRAVTRDQPTDDGVLITRLARRLLAELNTSGGVRLLGVGVSTLYDFAQDDLFSTLGEDPPDFTFPPPSRPATTYEPVDAGFSDGTPPIPPAQPVPPAPSSPTVPAAFDASTVPAAVPPASTVPAAPAAATVSAAPGAPSPATASPSALSTSPALASPALVASEPSVSSAVPVPVSPPVVMSGPADAAVPSAAQPSSPSGPGGNPESGVPADVPVWRPGQDVLHDEYGAGWVQGSGVGRVTVRFEGPLTPRGPIRTFLVSDPHLHATDPPDWRPPASPTVPSP
ncbi:DNA polymerase IV [Actinoplanes utahensis]|uniref:DNA polymerase IV n=1 Tax=Actinoplanes utahensis TaxID=1869 RepID=A0A0A6UWA0_ACTUT|nr:DNA polymerase IV [Actinoplanes utahensis]KHD79193.1 DNA repair nucleotidyltransferase [Actinoplanes utahensis]GIF30403.1 hypothetical protein Aut01nite_33890 [Actinoplanes utahensis]